MPNNNWEKLVFSCNPLLFENLTLESLTPGKLDHICKENNIVWEEVNNGKEVHVHGCGIECNCHGGVDNKNLRPIPGTK